ncbi:MAG: hypothetical protein GPJ54_20225 [Candidatus Heimdallarchaeota archaeon]|nr:hypothetical protein [Candidatus Heimdallarchaeota archaeon]
MSSRKKIGQLLYVLVILLLLSNVSSVFGSPGDIILPNDSVAYPMIENGDFEMSTHLWSKNIGTDATISPIAVRTGNSGLHVENSDQQAVLTYDFTDRLNEIKEKNYQVSFQGYFRSDDDSVEFKLEYYIDQWTGVNSQWIESDNDWVSPQISTSIPSNAVAIRVQILITDLATDFDVDSYLDDLLISYGPQDTDKETLHIYDFQNNEFTQESYGLAQQNIEILSVTIPLGTSGIYDVIFRVNTLAEINSEHDNVNFRGKHGVYRISQSGSVATGSGTLNALDHGYVIIDDTSTFVVDESTNTDSGRDAGIIGGIMTAAQWINSAAGIVGYGNPYVGGALLMISASQYLGTLVPEPATSISHLFSGDIDSETDFFKTLASSTVYRYTYDKGTNNEVCITTSHSVGWWEPTDALPEADNIFYHTSTCLTLDPQISIISATSSATGANLNINLDWDQTDSTDLTIKYFKSSDSTVTQSDLIAKTIQISYSGTGVQNFNDQYTAPWTGWYRAYYYIVIDNVIVKEGWFDGTYYFYVYVAPPPAPICRRLCFN